VNLAPTILTVTCYEWRLRLHLTRDSSSINEHSGNRRNVPDHTRCARELELSLARLMWTNGGASRNTHLDGPQ